MDSVPVDAHVVNKFGNVSALACENKFGRGVINANDSFAKFGNLVDAGGDRVIKVGTRAKRSAEGSGGAIAVQDLGGTAHILCVPSCEFLSAVIGANQPTRTLDIIAAKLTTG